MTIVSKEEKEVSKETRKCIAAFKSIWLESNYANECFVVIKRKGLKN